MAKQLHGNDFTISWEWQGRDMGMISTVSRDQSGMVFELFLMLGHGLFLAFKDAQSGFIVGFVGYFLNQFAVDDVAVSVQNDDGSGE